MEAARFGVAATHGAGVSEITVDIADETFIVASRELVATRLADPVLWRVWWPELRLDVTRDRGLDGLIWAVSGALAGTAEIWLESWHDGVIVHWFLRGRPCGDDKPARVRRAYATDFKRHITMLKDELDRGRPVGSPREWD